MRAFPLLAGAAIVALTLAGCSSGPADDGLPDCVPVESEHIDLITPGCWDVAGHTDHTMAWVHNPTDAFVVYEWRLTRADGTAFPLDWEVSFNRAAGSMAPNGTGAGAKGSDWAWTRIQLKVPPSVEAQVLPALLEARSPPSSGAAFSMSTPVTLTIHGDRGRVSAPGDQVTVSYEGRFHDTGEMFDSGDFPLKLGASGAIVGFSNGAVGLRDGEPATLVIPPAFAYGYDNPPGSSHERFNGKTLRFDITVDRT